MGLPKLLWGRPDELTTFPLMGIEHAHRLGYLASTARSILEIGAGGSTIWLAQIAPRATIVSLETSEKWRQDVMLLLLAMKQHGASMGSNVVVWRADPAMLDSHGPFDLVFVDGRREDRSGWLAMSIPHVRSGGHIALHDAERPEVQDAILEFESHHGVREYCDTDETYLHGGVKLWIGRKS